MLTISLLHHNLTEGCILIVAKYTVFLAVANLVLSTVA